MKEFQLYSHYCTGCGLCKAKKKAELFTNTKGYYELENGDIDWLKNICPCSGKQTSEFSAELWGKYENIYLGWSTDDELRKLASSGGILTELASFLVDNNMVDGIIHTQAGTSDPTKTESCISTSRDELIRRCGSRYAISHPLEIVESLDLSKKYAFIGKPCDVDALSNAFFQYPELRESIILTMSFFCAGLPSFDAQNKLLSALGCEKENCRSLRYRGDGWPGFATACDYQGNEHKIDYDTSWGKILGRDIMPMCRVCMNGIGESADISCADGWYLTAEGKPDFSEHTGRNIIFARSAKGLDIINNASRKGQIHIEQFEDAELILPHMQYFQAERRQSMSAKKTAMKLFLRQFPNYPSKLMKEYRKTAPLKFRFRIFKGTIKRIIKGTV